MVDVLMVGFFKCFFSVVESWLYFTAKCQLRQHRGLYISVSFPCWQVTCRRQWFWCIPRANLNVMKHTVICQWHFKKRFVLTEDKVVVNGVETVITSKTHRRCCSHNITQHSYQHLWHRRLASRNATTAIHWLAVIRWGSGSFWCNWQFISKVRTVHATVELQVAWGFCSVSSVYLLHSVDLWWWRYGPCRLCANVDDDITTEK